MDETSAQIWLLVDNLKFKIEALSAIKYITDIQTDLIKEGNFLSEEFSLCVSRKQEYIDNIDSLDKVFLSIYDRVKDFIGSGNTTLIEPIKAMQDKIKHATDLEVSIKIAEERNSYFTAGTIRKPPKKIVSASHVANAYKKQKKLLF